MMRKLLNIALVSCVILMQLSCNNKEKYVIKGTVDSIFELDSIYLYLESNSTKKVRIIGRSPVVDGKFRIEGHIDTIQKGIIGNLEGAGDGLGPDFILENADFEVKIGEEYAYVYGGKINEMVYGFYNTPKYLELSDLRSKLMARFMSIDTDDEDLEEEYYELRRKIEDIEDEMLRMDDAAKHKVITDPNAPVVAKMLAIISSQDWYRYDIKEREELLDEYEKELNNHVNILIYRKYLEAQKLGSEMEGTVVEGSKYKQIYGIDDKGNKLPLNKFIGGKNKYTLLEFWASWCAPCRAEMPTLRKAYDKFHKKGFEIYSVSIDEKEISWKNALQEENNPWINVLSVGEEGSKMVMSYGVQGVPASFLIDENGTIVAVGDKLRGEGLAEFLGELLK